MAFSPELLAEIRARFAHVDRCPFQGERVFFENAGGALTLKSVVETSAGFAAIPDNQGRDNIASKALVDIIQKARQDAHGLFNASGGQIFVGESGTELLFRLIRSACVASGEGGSAVFSTVEHPATRSAIAHWATVTGKELLAVVHDDAAGSVGAQAYAASVRPDTRVATILHCSPVTGIGNDVAAIAAAIRTTAPDCFIIVDGIQFAAHGAIDIDAYGIDGYVVSPYKMFSRHGYGLAWISDRLGAVPHERLIDGPELNWEFGTRDTGSYATFSDVVAYLDWLGAHFTASAGRRARIEAAASAIQAQEHDLCTLMLEGEGNLTGLAHLPGVGIVAGAGNEGRKGLVSFWKDGMPAAEIVAKLNEAGIRTHVRKADHYSANILAPLGLEACVRVSVCHYNSRDEVKKMLSVLNSL
ncbi:MAG: aminotransferase class V-fold PLP-dependent enzyme [Nitratireductor sp.]|nr:aminotransferase class V-fold PLP-dependent enzyme [Nitratireductor sp.]